MILKKSSSLTRSDIGTNFPWFLWQLKSFLFPIVPFVVPSICGSSCNRGKYFRPDNCCCKKTKSFTSLFGPSTTFTNSHFTSLSETLIVSNSLSLWSLLDVISYKLIEFRTYWTEICKCMNSEINHLMTILIFSHTNVLKSLPMIFLPPADAGRCLVTCPTTWRWPAWARQPPHRPLGLLSGLGVPASSPQTSSDLKISNTSSSTKIKPFIKLLQLLFPAARCVWAWNLSSTILLFQLSKNKRNLWQANGRRGGNIIQWKKRLKSAQKELQLNQPKNILHWNWW